MHLSCTMSRFCLHLLTPNWSESNDNRVMSPTFLPQPPQSYIPHLISHLTHHITPQPASHVTSHTHRSPDLTSAPVPWHHQRTLNPAACTTTTATNTDDTPPLPGWAAPPLGWITTAPPLPVGGGRALPPACVIDCLDQSQVSAAGRL